MKVFRFYAVTFGYSWTIWILGIYLFKGAVAPSLLVSVGGIGTIVGVITYWLFSYTKPERKSYLKRLISEKEVPHVYWILAIIIPILIIFISKLAETLVAARTAAILLNTEFIEAGWMYPFFLLFFGPLPEEMAWRGIALDALSEKSVVKAQFIVALMWALWHIPLFFIQGSYQFELGVFTLGFWLFLINVIFPSFIVGWLYIKSNRSILVAILFHYILNLSGEMFYLTQQGEIIETILTAAVAIYLLCEQTLSQKSKDNYCKR